MFSFFLAIPTMMAATFYDLVKSSINFTSSEKYLITIGCITAFLSSIVAINFFLKYVSQNNLKNFAYYRIITAIVIWGIFYLRF